MTSSSSTGSARINLQFDLNRKIDSAARECRRPSTPRAWTCRPPAQQPDLPQGQPVRRARDHPALTSKTRTPGQIYDAVSNLVQQKVAQVKGVGDVELGGGSLPAVRVELLPYR
jgi:multidrug efflux pump